MYDDHYHLLSLLFSAALVRGVQSIKYYHLKCRLNWETKKYNLAGGRVKR